MDRTVTLTHKGEVLSTMAVEGGARMVSEPFVPTGEIDLLDISVKEQSRPIPRRFTLWNRWVVQDPRSLALGVSEIRVVDEDQVASVGRPSKESYTGDDVRQSLVFDGLYSDDWLGRRFELRVPRGAARRVVVNGRLVQLGDARLPYKVVARINGTVTREIALAQYGDFSIPLELPTGDETGVDDLELDFENSLEVQTFYVPDQNVRRISARLRSVDFLGGLTP